MDKIKLITPSFDDKISSLIFNILAREYYVRNINLPKHILKDFGGLLNLFESHYSARIEGNKTSVISILEHNLKPSLKKEKDSIKEVNNIHKCINWINSQGSFCIDHKFFFELSERVAQGLIREGDSNAGAYRNLRVRIAGTTYTPPNPLKVKNLMDDLIHFINDDTSPHQYNLIKVALAHERFEAIHPFNNGNGRIGRLLSYAMLKAYKSPFIDYINPTSIFCKQREKYYKLLELSQTNQANGKENFVLFFLTGVYEEVKKSELITNRKYLEQNFFFPVINSLEISEIEKTLLKSSLYREFWKSNDFQEVINSKRQRTYTISKLLDKKFIVSLGNKRVYQTSLFHNLESIRKMTELFIESNFFIDYNKKEIPKGIMSEIIKAQKKKAKLNRKL